MASLRATLPSGEERNWMLSPGRVILGREGAINVADDLQISRRHAELIWRNGKLAVRRLRDSKNPVYFESRDMEFELFEVGIGQSFAIGKTNFFLEDDSGDVPHTIAADAPEPASVSAFDSAMLAGTRYLDADQRIEVLASLPQLIQVSHSNEELHAEVVRVLIKGVPRARFAAVVRLLPGDPPQVELLASEQHSASAELPPPSRKLVAQAVEDQQSVFYHWALPAPGPGFTFHDGFDWAICTPFPRTQPASGLEHSGLYIAGRFSTRQRPTVPATLFAGDLKFSAVVADIFAALWAVRRLQQEQEQTASAFRVARDIQAGFFPKRLPEVPGYEFAAGSESADATGGDYYDLIRLRSGNLGLVVADVCGHGLGPSLLMASLRATLRGFAVHEPEPEVMLTDLNQALFDDLRPRFRFITIVYGMLDPIQHCFRFANAGHSPVMLHFQAASSTFRRLTEDENRGCPLGIVQDPYQACATIQLEPGDLLVLGSDGLVETRRQGKQFGMESLETLIREGHQQPLAELYAAIHRATREFQEGGRLDDDLTLLLCRRSRPPAGG